MAEILRRITVEPIAFFMLFGYLLYSPVEPSGLFNAITNYIWDDIKDLNSHDQEDAVKRAYVNWGIYANIINIPVTTFITMMLGAWADLRGRQINMMFGLTSIVLYLAGRIILWSQWNGSGLLSNGFFFPMWEVLFFELGAALLGDSLVTYTAGLAFLADVVPDKTDLTIRLNYVVICRYVGGCAGAILAVFFAERVHITWWVLGVQSLLVINFYYTLLRIPQVPPIKIWHEFLHQGRAEARLHKGYVSRKMTSLSETESGAGDSKGPFTMLGSGLELVWQGVRVVLKKRDKSKRMLINMMVLTWFMEAVVFYEKSSLLAIYTQGHPFLWKASELGIFLALRQGLTGIGSGAGVYVLKKVFKMQDTLIIATAIAFSTASMIPIVLATKGWHIYLSAAIGMFGSMDQSTRNSFLSRLVEPDEVGKIYTFNSVILAIAYLFIQTVLQKVYAWSLDIFPKLVWLIIIVLGVAIFFMVVFVHFRAKAEGLSRSADELSVMRPAHDDDASMKGSSNCPPDYDEVVAT